MAQQQTLGRFFGGSGKTEKKSQPSILSALKKSNSGSQEIKNDPKTTKKEEIKDSAVDTEAKSDTAEVSVSKKHPIEEESEESEEEEDVKAPRKRSKVDEMISTEDKVKTEVVETSVKTKASVKSDDDLDAKSIGKLEIVKKVVKSEEIEKAGSTKNPPQFAKAILENTGDSIALPAKIPYAFISDIFEKIEAESSRLKITAIIASFFLSVLQQSTPETLVKIVYLFINRLGPDYEPDLELGLGETLLIKAISECYGRPIATIKRDYQELGDLGIVAQKSRSGQPPMFKPAPLDVDTVFANLTSIAKNTGKDSQSRKISTINKMLTACDMKTSEAKFLIRSLEGKLRIGLAEKTVLIGLSQAFANYAAKKNSRASTEELASADEIIREAFSQIPNYEIVIHKAYQYGISNLLEHCQLTPGIPLKPMLAKPTKSITEVLDRFQGEEFTCEYKYDGERAQIHLLGDGSVRIYSRNSEDMSQRYPDLISTIDEFLKRQTDQGTSNSIVMDCEVVAWDTEKKKILPFQVLSTRKRKDVDAKDIKVQICVFAFDMLYFNEPLITKPFAERRSIMHGNLTPVEGKFQFATAKNSSNLDELQTFLDQAVKDQCEGLMVKMLNGKDSYYEPSKRSRNWLKLKKDYLAGVGDSLDLVVIGGYFGKGKRTGSYGGFLLASYNQDSGEYESTCKIGTGFSDEDLVSLHAKLKETEILQAKPYVVYDTTNSSAKPDVWFEPTLVFEVLVADLSLSPVYKAAHQQYTKGISLRFPRFIRVRDDKSVEDATSSDQIAEFYERQASVN